MKKIHIILFSAVVMMLSTNVMGQQVTKERIDLSGEWNFRIDSLDQGIAQQWFNKNLTGKIKLPGSMTTNKGDDITVNTPWTGSIVDSSWFFKPEYAKYRQAGKYKSSFLASAAKVL